MELIKRATPRAIRFTPGINPYAQGSVIAEFGNTRVHVTAMITDDVPRFLKGSGKGWITAEYAMLPASTQQRSERDRKSVSGRSTEIQRLIGRSLRAAVDLSKMGERTIYIDCDVLVADGGTRTTAISGGYVALALAVGKLLATGALKENPLREQIAAISVGIDKEGLVIADLNYQEDSSCGTDMNIVMTRSNKFIEVQGTAEGAPFGRAQLDALLACAEQSLQIVFAEQDRVLCS